MPASTKKKRLRSARPASRTAPAARKKKPATRGLKTLPTEASVARFLATLDHATRADCERVDAWMSAATGSPGVMYGTAIVGYGTSTIRYADGREAPWMKMGFSPRKQALTLYGVLRAAPPALLGRLGKHDTGKGCLYVKRLADVDAGVLQEMVERAAAG